MKVLKMFLRDMRLGTVRHWMRFLIIPLVVVLMSSWLAEYAQSMYNAGATAGLGSAADYYLYVMQGMYIYKFSPDSEFVIPITWFMLHIGMAYLIAYYPYKDYSEFGVITFMAGGSRSHWWIAKMLWCFATVTLYYIVIVATCTIRAYMDGATMSGIVSVDLLGRIFGDCMQYVSQSDLILISIVLPFAVSVMMTELQMLLSFLLTPVISFAMMCGLYIVSAYYTCWWLPGNYAMWQRSAYMNYEGVKPESGFVLAAFVLFATIVCGLLYFREKDIIK